MSEERKNKIVKLTGDPARPLTPEHPTIFDWLVDTRLGFWSPVINQLPKSIIDSGPIMLEEGIEENIMPKVEREKTEKKLTREVEAPDELAKAYQEASETASSVTGVAIGTLAATTAAASIPFVHLGDAIDEIWRMPALNAGMQWATDYFLAYYSYNIRPKLQRYYFRYFKPLVPEAYRLALAAAKGILTDEEYKEAMAENGLNETWAEMWREENRTYPTFTQLTDMYWRGVIDEETFKLWMKRNGYSDEVIEAFSRVREVIPPLSDLIRFAVREAYPVGGGEGAAAELPEELVGVSKQQFEEMRKWAKQRGLSDYWVDRYWLAHFNRMSLTQAYENLWRGYFTDEDFKRYLMLADIHPEDWDAILRVAYRPPTLRELGYGYDAGVYKLEDIEKYRRWEGLSPEDAKLAAQALVAYRTEAEREALRREYMYLFAYGRITEEEFREKLKELITSKEATELWVERAKIYRERIQKYPVPEESVAITASEAKWAFVHGLKDEMWLREKLKTLGWTAERIDIYVEQAKLEREEYLAELTVKPLSKLTLAQIRDMLRFGLISNRDLPKYLEAIGYTGEGLDLMVKYVVRQVELEKAPQKLSRTDMVRLYDLRINVIPDDVAVRQIMIIRDREGEPSPTYKLYEDFLGLGYAPGDAARLTIWTALNLRFPDLRAMYRNGWISARQMYEELLALGLPEDRADELMRMTVKVEKPARLQKERDLTKSEIIKGVKAGLITAEQAVRLLEGLGYEEWEAWFILAVNKVVSAGDPEGYWEARKLIELYKRAAGLPYVEIPDRLIELEKKVRELRDKLEKMREAGESEVEISRVAAELAGLEAEYRRLMIQVESGKS